MPMLMDVYGVGDTLALRYATHAHAATVKLLLPASPTTFSTPFSKRMVSRHWRARRKARRHKQYR